MKRRRIDFCPLIRVDLWPHFSFLLLRVFASFAVVGGSFVDYIPMLEFVLRDKRARGERLRAVFLALDVDGFGSKPFTNYSNQFLLPPALSGESAARFWWISIGTPCRSQICLSG